MTKFVLDKKIITQKVLSVIQDDNYTQSDLEMSLFKWWSNIRSDGGLRLTDEGHRVFNDAGLENFGYHFDKWTSSLLLKFDRYMPCPYHLDIGAIASEKSHVRIYDSRVAMLIGLHGTIIDYVDSLEVKRADLSISSKL
jgi:hypothetical protein